MKQAIADNLFHIIMGFIFLTTLTLGLTLHENPTALVTGDSLIGFVWLGGIQVKKK